MSIKSIESIVISASQFRTLLDLWTQNETKNDQLASSTDSTARAADSSASGLHLLSEILKNDDIKLKYFLQIVLSKFMGNSMWPDPAWE